MISKAQIEQQKNAIEGLYEKVKDAPDSERKIQAVAYCEGCIAACSLALQVMNGTTASVETEKENVVEPVEEKVVETVEVEEKPKRKSAKKKKEEPAKVVEPEEPEVNEPEVEEEDDDLDDLL